MIKFTVPFFRSKSIDVENEYNLGVEALQAGDFYTANDFFLNAAKGGHVSAFFNLSLLLGGGYITPYDFDLAADYWYKAAAAGHSRAKSVLWQLEAADRGGLGTDNLVKYVLESGAGNALVPSIMICAARFYDVVSRKYGATVDVISYELDAASNSDLAFVHSYIKRTGLDENFYKGGLDRLKEGSAADQITDGLNNLYFSMIRAGVSENLSLMARCSIVGYLIAKSPYGEKSKALLGLDKFFSVS